MSVRSWVRGALSCPAGAPGEDTGGFVPLEPALGLPRDIWVRPPLPPLQPLPGSVRKLLWAGLGPEETLCSATLCRRGINTQTWL